ncbi:uncharacterized [Tachysurus ichikawai]
MKRLKTADDFLPQMLEIPQFTLQLNYPQSPLIITWFMQFQSYMYPQAPTILLFTLLLNCPQSALIRTSTLQLSYLHVSRLQNLMKV